MDKLILIDGNSLLNRAYYAMRVFTTKDGLPTNGIFGFVKLLLKIAEDENPQYLAVAFDVHAPTFRHERYPSYKGTRKPMPEDLVVQVPILKELLAAMKVCTVELKGYEADDLIGTLSRKFENVRTLIYTGDRDCYQLVRPDVEVCFTRKGVSEIDRLNDVNFVEKVGLTPSQIIEEKALMGDSSDNIPGVAGVGSKTALSLLQDFGTVQNIYDHLQDIPINIRARLIRGKKMAFFSHFLATINTEVPLSLTLEDCRFTLPFPEEAREYFARLEFRSLVESKFFPEKRPQSVEPLECLDMEALLSELKGESEFAFCAAKEGFYLSYGDKEYFFPLRENFLEPGYFLNELRPLLEALFTTGKRAIVSDVKSILHLLSSVDLQLSCTVEDVTLLRYLFDSNQRPSDPKQLAKDLSLSERNCASALRMALAEAEKKVKGTTEEKLYRDLELPLCYVLYDMEKTGVRVDLKKFPEFSEKYKRELAGLSAQIYELAGVDSFNLNSPFQLSEVLFEKLGLDPKGAKKNVRGGYSTSAEVLEKLAEDHEIARLILRYRELQKLQSTYIDGIRPLVQEDVVHTTYNQTMTTTGRLSSANPNLQNIPVRTDEGRELRKLFIAREGNILIDADYSQIELRLLAHLSGCKSLIEAYQKGEDVHAATAARVFGVPLSEVTATMRRRAKTINFGIIYGMSAFGLSKDLGCSANEAQKFINKYFEMHPEVKRYMDENVRLAKEQGFVTTFLGRKRNIPEIRSTNFNLRAFGERAAMNMPLQGSAADIIKIAMLRVFQRLQEGGFRSKLVLQVHDELVLDSPLDEAERAAAMLKEEMEHAVELSIPLTVEISSGKSWYDAK